MEREKELYGVWGWEKHECCLLRILFSEQIHNILIVSAEQNIHVSDQYAKVTPLPFYTSK